MVVENLGEIKAVAFDIDGTLYKAWHLYRKLPFYFLHHINFFLNYSKARKDLRKEDDVSDFHERQAEYMARCLHCSLEEAHEKINRIVYDGLKRQFEKIKPCKFMLETVQAFKQAGLKIALLSDFPPEQKGELWGIKPYCDVILGAENCGSLKPSPIPFKVLAEKLGVESKEVLYVGNSFKYDVLGSKKVGMKAAWFVGKWKYFWHKNNKTADLVFYDYKKLMNAVLK